METQYGNLAAWNWLWLVALCGGLAVMAAVMQRSAVRQFATSNLLRQYASRRDWFRFWGAAFCSCLSMFFLVVALVDIRWGKIWQNVPQKGIEIMFVLDVSRSMLAEDATPNRLERAKQQITDTIDAIAGDRIGLVLFAGDAHQAVPMTHHYEDFKRSLQAASPLDSRLGGSRLGNAIEVAARGFLGKTSNHKVMIVFTDGEDQASEPIQTARRVFQEQGIRIFTVGLGDMKQGARIPIHIKDQQGYLQHAGEQVWSKLNGAILRQVATETEGAYIPAGTKSVDMAGVYHRYMAKVEKQSFERAKIHRYEARYQWFLGPAILLLIGQIVIAGMRRSPRKPKSAVDAMFNKAITILLFLGGSLATHVHAEEPSISKARDHVKLGNQLLSQGDSKNALEQYQKAEAFAPNDVRVKYNQGVALAKMGQFAAAAKLFQNATVDEDRQLAARSRYNLGNVEYANGLKASKQNPSAAIEKLQSAIQHYRASLRLDPSDNHARINIELANRLVRQLQQAKERKPENPSEDQQQSDGKQDGEKGDAQNEQQSQKGQQGEQQNQDGEQEQGDSQNESGSQGDQENPDGEQEQVDSQEQQNPTAESKSSENQKTGESQTETDESDSSLSRPTPDPNRTNADGDKEGKQDAKKEGTEGSDEKADKNQGGAVPEGDLSAINENVDDPDTTSSQITKTVPPMTQQEAEKMLQAVRDRDMARRLRLLRRRQSRRTSVEKDW